MYLLDISDPFHMIFNTFRNDTGHTFKLERECHPTSKPPPKIMSGGGFAGVVSVVALAVTEALFVFPAASLAVTL